MDFTTRKKIIQLPQDVADKIAAGEVVTRPLSIVKELVENAIDAGASVVTVEIRNGGKSYIRITDDGCGIPREEAELAFMRHATSKIEKATDLDSILTLGFRGEALASIAAVSRTELITKTRDEKTGTRLSIEGGVVVEKCDTGCPDGTTFIVADLFYNTPARQKFLKADHTESTLIIDFISKMALAYPAVKMRMINNGNILFSTPGKGDIYANILTIYSKDIGSRLIRFHEDGDEISVSGFLSPPSQSKTNRKHQIFFVNGRNIGSKLLDNAVKDGYTEKLFEGRYPIVFLFIQVAPEKLDVNIHPNKLEVRFDQEKEIRAFVATAIQKALSTKEAVPEVRSENLFRKAIAQQSQKDSQADWPTERKLASQLRGHEKNKDFTAAPGAPAVSMVIPPGLSEYRDKEEQVDIKTLLLRKREAQQKEKEAVEDKKREHSTEKQNLFSVNQEGSTLVDRISEAAVTYEAKLSDSPQLNAQDITGPVADAIPPVTEQSTQSTAFDSQAKGTLLRSGIEDHIPEVKQPPFDVASITATGSVFNTYITGVDDTSFYLIDQHAAHERIFYEQLLAEYYSEEKHSQMILTPFIVEVTFAVKNDSAEFLEYLVNMGFAIEEFGPKSFIVKEIPMLMDISEAQEFIQYFLDNISEGTNVMDTKKLDRIITKSCKQAVKAHDHLDKPEIDRLMADLARCRNPFSCPHGRPTIIKMTKYEIEKMFKRV